MKSPIKAKPVRFTHQGKQYRFKSIRLACKQFNIPHVPVYARIKHGWTVRQAVTTPLRNYTFPNYKGNPEVAAFLINRVPTVSTAKH